MLTTNQVLSAIGACNLAKDWHKAWATIPGNDDASAAWDAIPRASWLLFLASAGLGRAETAKRLGVDRGTVYVWVVEEAPCPHAPNEIRALLPWSEVRDGILVEHPWLQPRKARRVHTL